MSTPATLVPIIGGASDDERLAALWHAYYGQVYAYARRRTSAHVAAEVAAATFTVLWQRIDDPPAEPLPWLFAVARRQLANLRRGEARRNALHLRLGRSRRTASDPADGAIEQDHARAVLARLRPQDREVLMLVAWEGLDPPAAAASLGVSPATFAVRLHRARQRLEAELSAHPEETEEQP